MIRRFLRRFSDMIPRQMPVCCVWLAGLEGIVDPATMLNGFLEYAGASDRSDPSLLDVILEYLMAK